MKLKYNDIVSIGQVILYYIHNHSRLTSIKMPSCIWMAVGPTFYYSCLLHTVQCVTGWMELVTLNVSDFEREVTHDIGSNLVRPLLSSWSNSMSLGWCLEYSCL